jgi:hypothetical protein
MADSDPASICIPSAVSIEDCLARARSSRPPAPSPPELQCSDPRLFLSADAICIAETIGTELPISYAPHVLRKYNGSHPDVHVTMIGI